MRVKATISYDGSKFYGFQIQSKSDVPTVAGKLQKALLNLNIKGFVRGSGRTDKGVHATAQVIDFEIPSFWSDLKKLKNRLNQILSPYIYIKSIIHVKDDFNSRFDAKKRLYRYLMYSGEFKPHLADFALHVEKLNSKNLNSIVKTFEGKHNFKNFKKEGTPTNSDERIIYKAGAYKYKNFYIVYFLGNGFLRSQVRMMSDFALKVEKEKLSLTQLKEQLECKKIHSRSLIKPNGLYLSKIHY
jgi:tRNA pseudouridine38-40 synthase